MKNGEPTKGTGLATFVAFQAIFWGLLSSTLFLPGQAQMLGLTTHRAIYWLLASLLVGLVVSSGLAWILVRIPEHLMRGGRAIGAVLAVCVLGGLVWMSGMAGFEGLAGIERWIPPNAPPGYSSTGQFFFRGTFLFAMWSPIFLVGLLLGRFQREREHRLAAHGLAHEAQLQLLRSQLNPHFLFNALNSVIALVDEDPKIAQSMVRDIAALLRKSLDADRGPKSTVANELEFIRLYVKCEKVRFEQRLNVSYAVDDATLAMPLPSMLFHPLVENAIKHGMQADAEVLEVKVAVRRENDALVLEVANSGTLRPQAGALPNGTGIGVRNVEARLRALFPDRHRFELSEAAGWVTARITCNPA